MNKGLDLIQRQEVELIDGCPTGNVYIGLTQEELVELEKELKALKVIKKYFWLESFQDFIAFDGRLPKYKEEECDLLKEGLSKEVLS